VRDLSGLSKERMSAAFERLIAAKAVERCSVKVKIGSGAERDAVGVRRAAVPKDPPPLY
jgi:hypothetical protein